MFDHLRIDQSDTMNKAKQHANRKDDWMTPPEIFDPLNAIFDFSIDLAANKRSRKVTTYVGPDHNSRRCRDFLALPKHPGIWLGSLMGCTTAWINPPYGRGNLGPFTSAIVEIHSIKALQVDIVALLPCSIGTRWFQANVFRRADIYCREGRISFLDPKTGLRVNGNTGDNIIAHYRQAPLQKTWQLLQEAGWNLLSKKGN